MARTYDNQATSGTLENSRNHLQNSRIWRTGLLAGVAALIANLAIFFIGTTFFGVESNPQLLNPFSITATSLLGGLGGAALLWGLNRFTRRPVAIFRIVAGIFLLLSLGGPISAGSSGMPGVAPVNGATVAAMLLMHVITGGLAIYLLTTRTRTG